MGAGNLDTVVEKKIDLPNSWMNGFLQVQSASILEGTNLTISSECINEVLSYLTRNKEKESPRYIKFILSISKRVLFKIIFGFYILTFISSLKVSF